MYAIAIIRYRRALEEMLPVVEEHRSYMRSLHEQGILLASGPMDPRTGGMLLLRVPDNNVHAALDAIRDDVLETLAEEYPEPEQQKEIEKVLEMILKDMYQKKRYIILL